MSIDVFQGCCVAVLFVAYAATVATARQRLPMARDVALLCVAAWIGEQSCISLYRFYAYASGWWLMIGDVPLLVPLIWPLVIISSRQVVNELWPNLTPSRRAAAVAIAVLIDASLMEIIAVAGGLWRWVESGYFDVPLIGLFGWVFFGFAASICLDAPEGSRGAQAFRRLALPVIGPAVTHALLQALWWIALRWGLRTDLGPGALLGFAVVAGGACVAVFRARSAHRMSWSTAAPRIIASSLFFVLLLSYDGENVRWLWIHTALVALPYLLAIRIRPERASANKDVID